MIVVVVEHERRSAAGSGTPADGSGIAAESGIAAADKVADWRIGVWASAGRILVVVGLSVGLNNNNNGCDGGKR